VAAVKLLDKAVRTARPDDDRISSDPAAAGSLARMCGGLPLALQITAALLVGDPALSAAELAEEMADEVRRLQALRYDDGSGVGAPSVAAAFELSYRQLDQDSATLFRLLSAAPGPDVSTEAAAELAGWPGAGGDRPADPGAPCRARRDARPVADARPAAPVRPPGRRRHSW
jgi:hypothetical protein